MAAPRKCRFERNGYPSLPQFSQTLQKQSAGYTRFYPDQPTFSYWQDKKNRDLEVDLIAEAGDRLVPFEVKYQDTATSPKKFKGLRLFLEEKKVTQGYVVTQRWEDFGVIETFSARTGREREHLDAKILVIPAPLACFWLSD